MSAVLHALALGTDGTHWLLHGASVPAVGTSRFATGPVCQVAVHSVRHPMRVQAQAHVVVETVADPFSLALRLLPVDARALAANLLLAAERAEAVQASLAALKGAGRPL